MKDSDMQIDGETIAWITGIFITIISWLGKMIWNNKTDLQRHTEYVARTYPTRSEIDEKFDDHKADLKYIRNKIDMLIERELNKKG